MMKGKKKVKLIYPLSRKITKKMVSYVNLPRSQILTFRLLPWVGLNEKEREILFVTVRVPYTEGFFFKEK